MKKLSFILALFMSSMLFAQDFEGTIKYEISYEDLTEEMKAHASMLPDGFQIEVDKEMSKVTQPSPMGGNPTVAISNQKTGESLTLMDVMGQKLALKISGEEKKEMEEKSEGDVDIKYIDGDEKEIAGYNCKKAILETKDGSEITIYYTEDLPNIDVSDQASGIKGFPMEITTVTDMFTTITRVTTIEEGKVDKIKMEVPEGYNEVSMEEFKKMFGGMGL